MTEATLPNVRRPLPTRIVRGAVRWGVRAVVVGAVSLLTLFVVRGLDARSKPDLAMWHTEAPDGEFTASDLQPGFTLADYLAIENRLFDQLDRFQFDDPDALAPFARYRRSGVNNPASFEANLNRTTELRPDREPPRAGVLLLHGLSDSPYSLRSIAELFRDKGCYALSLRLPGHGTVPGALSDTDWEDWMAAALLATRHVRTQIPEDAPLFICGYSNGGAIALMHALRALEDPSHPAPDALVLFSPSVGVSPFARVAEWHRVYRSIPYFEKASWVSISPEYDPYKYNSFPTNAGAQSWKITSRLRSELARLHRAGRLGELPPILTFQSIVDATIVGRDTVTRLYERIEEGESELVIFDVNRATYFDEFFGSESRGALDLLSASGPHAYRLTVLTNRDRGTSEVVARTREAGAGPDAIAVHPLDSGWPSDIYSLSHVAIPFPPDDPWYGIPPQGLQVGRLTLGTLAPRGERHVLRIPADQLLRLRYNPFHGSMIERIRVMIDRATTPGGSDAGDASRRP